MILLQSIIEVVITTVDDSIAKRFADCPGIGVMPIRRHLIWSMTNRLNCLLEKALGRLHGALLAEHRINQIAIPIDGPIEITPLPMHACP